MTDAYDENTRLPEEFEKVEVARTSFIDARVPLHDSSDGLGSFLQVVVGDLAEEVVDHVA